MPYSQPLTISVTVTAVTGSITVAATVTGNLTITVTSIHTVTVTVTIAATISIAVTDTVTVTVVDAVTVTVAVTVYHYYRCRSQICNRYHNRNYYNYHHYQCRLGTTRLPHLNVVHSRYGHDTAQGAADQVVGTLHLGANLLRLHLFHHKTSNAELKSCIRVRMGGRHTHNSIHNNSNNHYVYR